MNPQLTHARRLHEVPAATRRPRGRASLAALALAVAFGLVETLALLRARMTHQFSAEHRHE
jgi:hypothetical protein